MNSIANIYLKKINKEIINLSHSDDTFFNGKAGMLLYEFYLWQATHQKKHYEKANQLINEIFENLNNDNPKFSGASYANGAAGFCYVVTILNKYRFLEISLDEDLASLDEYLFEEALKFIEEYNLDFWHGAFGIVFYFLERLDNISIKQNTEFLIEKIIKKAITSDKGLWFPNIINTEDRDFINLSLSHGQTAFLIILMQAYEKGLCHDIIPEIIRQGTDFVVSQFQESDFGKDKYSFFPIKINTLTNEKTFKNRLGLCYGDLNVVLLLYRASDFLDDSSLRRTADLVGLSTLLRKDTKMTLIKDAHLCHGAAGVAQFYCTFYKLTEIEAYQKGYEYWIDQTLTFLDQHLEDNDFGNEKTTLLNGLTGIGLVLLSYVSKEKLDWEKIFLL